MAWLFELREFPPLTQAMAAIFVFEAAAVDQDDLRHGTSIDTRPL
jgi:hypothetical protein